MVKDLELIYRTYKDNIYAIGFNYFGDPTDADDIVQETFYKLSKSNTAFENEDHIRNWLNRVAVNECKRTSMSFWRKRRKPLDDYIDSLVFESEDEGDLFSEVMKLKPKYRQVIHLFYYEGYSTDEISRLLKISRSAVTTRLARARKQLKEHLQEVWDDE